jgi:molecular chaperone Hsp33
MTSDGQFRLFAADTAEVVQNARDLHDLSPLATILMGRMISLAALMSAELKSPEDELTLRVEGSGELRGGVVITDMRGNIRCYAYNPHVYIDIREDNFMVGKNLGDGYMSVMRNLKGQPPYTGTIPLQSGEIGEDAVYYYQQSAQTPTAINLGVLIDPHARIRTAGGIMLQQLPEASESLIEKIEKNMALTPNISDLMDMGLSLEEILNRFVLRDIPWECTDRHSIRYHCTCSKESFARALLLLGKEELAQMSSGIVPVCHYCNRSYSFDTKDIEDIIKTLEST